MSKLATALNDLGDARAAADLHRQAAVGFELLLGPDDPNTLASRSNLAAALHNLNELHHSERLQAQTLADCTRALEADHPHTLISRRHLAHVQNDRRQRIRRTSHPMPNHQQRMAPSHYDPEYAIHVLSALQLVRSTCEEVLAHSRRTLGRDHSCTQLCAHLHAEIRRNIDLVREVIHSTNDAPSTPKHILETGHINVIRARKHLAGLRSQLTSHRWSQAWRKLPKRRQQ